MLTGAAGMKWPKSVIVNVILNVVVVAICPLLVVAWLVRVRMIESLQARRRRVLERQGRVPPSALTSKPEPWFTQTRSVRRSQ
jgi:hypothetical protein